MRVNREQFVRALTSVTPGLATRESIEQSSCFVFIGGLVCTYNEEVCCRIASPVSIQGAVAAKPVLDLLGSMNEEVIDVEATGSELLIKGPRRKSGIKMESKVTLPISSVEDPGVWDVLDPNFNEAVRIVYNCASSEENKFELTCIHIHPQYVEACDRYQIARYFVDNKGLETLVRAESLKRIVGHDMVKVSVTPSWIHFGNLHGLVMSCRRYMDQYKDLSSFLDQSGMEHITLPGGLSDVVSAAEIFSSDNTAGNSVLVDVKSDSIVVEGSGPLGWYKEMRAVQYSGSLMRFRIAPKLLLEITKRSAECLLSEPKLLVNGGSYIYATSTVAGGA